VYIVHVIDKPRSVVTLEWSEITDSYNTPDTAVRYRWQKSLKVRHEVV